MASFVGANYSFQRQDRMGGHYLSQLEREVGHALGSHAVN